MTTGQVPPVGVRKPAIGRHHLERVPFRPMGRWRLPRWVRGLLVALLIQALLVALGAALNEVRKPRSLATSTLQGPRRVTGAICIDEAVDVSGSMLPFRADGARAERALFTFSRRELNPDDSFAEAFFAGSAQIAQQQVVMTDLRSSASIPGGINYDGTELAPAVEVLRAAHERAALQCAARALVVITDGHVYDADRAADALRRAGYTRVYAVVPAATGWGRPGELDGPLRAITVKHFAGPGVMGRLASVLANARPLDVVFGEIVADLTGQQLKQTKK